MKTASQSRARERAISCADAGLAAGASNEGNAPGLCLLDVMSAPFCSQIHCQLCSDVAGKTRGDRC